LPRGDSITSISNFTSGPEFELFKPLLHPRGKAVGCRPVFPGKAAEVSFNVPVVIVIIPEIDKELFQNPLTNFSAAALRLVSFNLVSGFTLLLILKEASSGKQSNVQNCSDRIRPK
jgi:hypothetical protein